MDNRILDHLNKEGMASLMNSTKWRELATALQYIKGTGPVARIKYLLDEYPSVSFCHIDWEWVKHGETSVIEWMEIDTIYKTYLGRLIPLREEDLRDAILAALKSVRVPFSVDGQVFRVWGYVKPE